ncbi:MAG: pseudouridine synthase [Polyangiaceae bacterium]
MNPGPDILYRDEHLAAVNKPSGLSVHRGWDADRDVLMARVRDALGIRVHPVHRIDRSASGVVLLALHAEAARQLGEQLARHAMVKTYVALVRGVPAESGVVDHPLPRREGGPRVESVTEFRRLDAFGRYGLVLARPRTGRPHQIRRHLKHIACPLIGDVRYGKGEHNRLFRSDYGLSRLALHACELRLLHPVTGEALRLRAPLPEDLSAPFNALAASVGAQFSAEALWKAIDAWT